MKTIYKRGGHKFMQDSASPPLEHALTLAQAGKYLTFQLSDETYGLEILTVQEIIGMLHVTRVPRTPPYLRGVINLRGKVIPVVDTRIKFGMAGVGDTQVTCIIVVKVALNDETVIVGLIVDAVAEVVDIGAGQIEPAPALGASVDTAFIRGMGKLGEKVVILLDVREVIENEIAELSMLSASTAA